MTFLLIRCSCGKPRIPFTFPIRKCIDLFLLGGSVVKNSPCQCRRHRRWEFDLWVGKIPWRRKWQPTPVFLPGRSPGQRSLAGCSPWGHKRVRHNWSPTTKDIIVNLLILKHCVWKIHLFAIQAITKSKNKKIQSLKNFYKSFGLSTILKDKEGFPSSSAGRESSCNAGSIPGKLFSI